MNIINSALCYKVAQEICQGACKHVDNFLRLRKLWKLSELYLSAAMYIWASVNLQK
jgi:hypothetical protein